MSIFGRGLQKSFFERDQFVLGIVGTTIALVLTAAAFQVNNLPLVSGGRTFHADFSDAGGLSTGDAVQVAGLGVGKVKKISIQGQHVSVDVRVTDGAVVLGKDTTARIITINVLGKKAVELQSRGTGSVASGATFHQSQAPYDITQALEGLTSKVGSIDVGKVTQALNAISSTFVDTPPQVTKALTGLQQVADTVASRDGALRQLLGEAKSVTGVLASRNDEIVSLLTDGSQLLSELDSRRDAITGLLANASKVAQQISGLVKDQQGKLAPALKQLRTAVHLLNDNKANVAAAISKLGPYATALGDAVGSGPYFTAYVPNLSDPSTLPIFPELLQGLGSSLGGAK